MRKGCLGMHFAVIGSKSISLLFLHLSPESNNKKKLLELGVVVGDEINEINGLRPRDLNPKGRKKCEQGENCVKANWIPAGH